MKIKLSISHAKHLLWMVLTTLILSSCGFHPVYEKNSNERIPSIEIAPINSVEGAEFYHRLSDIIDNNENARYQLQVKLVYTSSPLVISKDSDVLEQNVALDVHSDLLDKQTGLITKIRDFRIVGSYNAIFSPYISYTAEAAEKTNLAIRAADEVHKCLSVFFSQQIQLP
ncbi:MAG: hypothetical protein V4485_01240 [Pseudomonadota bacterium]